MAAITSKFPISKYTTRISGYRVENGRFRGIVSCSPGGIDHPDFEELAWPALADTPEQAMKDAGDLQFALDQQPVR